jgi:hypothetical protein
MMYFAAYLLIGSVVAYGIFTILKELSQEIKYVRTRNKDDDEAR